MGRSEQYLAITGRGRALADARKLLATTPWKRGFTLDLYTTNTLPRLVAANYLAASWAKLGVKANLIFVASQPPASPNLFGDWDHGGILQHGAFQVVLDANPFDSDLGELNRELQSGYIDREQSTHDANNLNASGIHGTVFDRGFPC